MRRVSSRTIEGGWSLLPVDLKPLLCASANNPRMLLQASSVLLSIISSMRPSHLSTSRQSSRRCAALAFSNTSFRVTHLFLCPFHAVLALGAAVRDLLAARAALERRALRPAVRAAHLPLTPETI